MNFRAWKAGLLVALSTGLLTGLIAYEVSDKIIIERFILFILACVAKDALLYLKQHPIEKVLEDEK